MARLRRTPSNAGRAGGLPQIVESVPAKMAAFDALPPRLREELNYTALDFSPLDAFRHLRQGICVRAIIAGIRAMVSEVFAEHRRAIGNSRRPAGRASATRDMIRA